MTTQEGKRPVTVVTACMTGAGLPDFALTVVEVTPEEADNGVHYYLAEAQLPEAGYGEPFVHFAGAEAPAFLVPAVRQYLRARASASEPSPVLTQEEP